jgi:hypothetical protein
MPVEVIQPEDETESSHAHFHTSSPILPLQPRTYWRRIQSKKKKGDSSRRWAGRREEMEADRMLRKEHEASDALKS